MELCQKKFRKKKFDSAIVIFAMDKSRIPISSFSRILIYSAIYSGVRFLLLIVGLPLSL